MSLPWELFSKLSENSGRLDVFELLSTLVATKSVASRSNMLLRPAESNGSAALPTQHRVVLQSTWCDTRQEFRIRFHTGHLRSAGAVGFPVQCSPVQHVRSTIHGSAVVPVSVCQYVSPSLFPNGVTSRAPEPVRQRETLSTCRDTEKGEKTMQERDDSETLHSLSRHHATFHLLS